TRLGELLLFRSGSGDLRGTDGSCAVEIAPVAGAEASRVGSGYQHVPASIPARGIGADPTGKLPASLAVGDRVMTRPRAGCGKSARPVRRAGSGNGLYRATPPLY